MGKNREILCDYGYEDSVVFDNPDYDEAIIGVTDDGRVVYSYSAIVRDLMEKDGMGEDEAREFVDYNVCRAAQYVEGGPIVVYLIDGEEIT